MAVGVDGVDDGLGFGLGFTSVDAVLRLGELLGRDGQRVLLEERDPAAGTGAGTCEVEGGGGAAMAADMVSITRDATKP